MQKKKWIKHFVLLAIGLVIFVLFIFFGEQSLQQLKKTAPLPLTAAFFATLGITLCIAFRWGSFSNALAAKKTTSWFRYYYYFIISRALGLVLPKDLTDFGWRIGWLKKKHKVQLSLAGTSVILDRMFDLLIMLIFLLAVLPYWLGWIALQKTFVLMAVLPVLAGLAVYFMHPLLFNMIGSMVRWARGLISGIPGLKQRVKGEYVMPEIQRNILVRVYALSVLKFGFTACRMILFAVALGIPVSSAIILVGTPLGQLSYLFAFTPGGLGIFEAGWYAVLRLANLENEHVIAFVVGQRILTIFIIMVLAALSHLVYVFKRNR